MSVSNIQDTLTFFTTNQLYSGFRLTERRYMKEVNALCLLFIHEKSGARVFKMVTDDPNKLFSITFKTLPSDDSGVPHILEHSVLNGSKKYPAKSPFDILIKGSLHTYLNALTAADYTSYPAASMNSADYFNLMDVYLDAVFNPLAMQDTRILKQEGWHYELMATDAPLVINGVVYNEMKGSFSNPMYLIYHLTNKYLFPDNTYGYSSAGYPEAIPELTQEKFVDFYKNHYHPSNSYIFLYGNADTAKELAMIHNNYLSGFEIQESLPAIPVQKAFDTMLKVTEPYPIPSGSEIPGNTYLSLSIVTNIHSGKVTTLALELILQALVNHESAPLRLALQEAGIGKDLTGWFTESRQNMVTIIVSNANTEDADRFMNIFRDTLRKVITHGFDSDIMEGILNRTEFQLKEGDTPQKGLMYQEMITEGWLFDGDPFDGLQYEEHLAELREGIRSGLTEKLISECLLENSHALLLILEPDPALQSDRDSRETERLKTIKGSLASDEIELFIKETRELIAYQQSEDSPEALASIPMLQLSDIGTEAPFYEIANRQIGNFQVLQHEQFTNGIVYVSLYFNLLGIPRDDIPYAALLQALLGKMGTTRYSYGQLENLLNIHTGGFVANLATFLELRSDENLLPQLVVSSKSLRNETGMMMHVLDEVIRQTTYNDKERLKTLISRLQARLEANVRQNGMNYAITRSNSYFSNRGMFNELTSGIDYYRFITRLDKDFSELSDELISRLEQTARTIFTSGNLKVHVTCQADDLDLFSDALTGNLQDLPSLTKAIAPWKFDFKKRNEAILSSSQVQYVVKSSDFKKLGYAWNGKFYVLNQILSTDWLQNRIRVQGGAYGGFSGFSPGGNAYFASYRDPNLKETLATFDATSGYLESFMASDTDMVRYIIGTIASLDQPKTPAQKGSAAMHCYFEKTSPAQLNLEREEVLHTTAADIRQLAGVVKDILEVNNFCVYGNETKLRDNAEIFMNMLELADEHFPCGM